MQPFVGTGRNLSLSCRLRVLLKYANHPAQAVTIGHHAKARRPETVQLMRSDQRKVLIQC